MKKLLALMAVLGLMSAVAFADEPKAEGTTDTAGAKTTEKAEKSHKKAKHHHKKAEEKKTDEKKAE